jgi:hypothetical protein
MKNRQELMSNKVAAPIDYSKIRIGAKKLEDATLTIGDYQKVSNNLATKMKVLSAM